MGTLTEFNPEAAGFRVATPIKRRKRRASARTAPKPQYADAVLYSFQHGTPLEVSVRTPAVEDTVRRLKRAARYQERQTGFEVRVQISVEPVTVQEVVDGVPQFDAHGDPVMVPVKPARSNVKFLGHAPWMLGRRISKARAEELGAVEPEVPAPAPARHRRTVAATRPRHARSALRHSLVRAVITAGEPLVELAGGSSFFLSGCRCQVVIYTVDSCHSPCASAGRFSPRDGRLVACNVTGSISRSLTPTTEGRRTPLRSGCAMTSPRSSRPGATRSSCSTSACRCRTNGARTTCPPTPGASASRP